MDNIFKAFTAVINRSANLNMDVAASSETSAITYESIRRHGSDSHCITTVIVVINTRLKVEEN